MLDHLRSPLPAAAGKALRLAEPRDDDALTTAEAARWAEVARHSIVRWIRDGVPCGGGVRVHLDADRVGGRWRIRRGAIDQFIRRCTAAAGGARATGSDATRPRPASKTQTRSARARRRRRAQSALRAMGMTV